MKSITYYWQDMNFVSIGLAPISFLFCSLVFFRRLLYRFNILKSVATKLPVIVVGNIYIGGNGKTPFVIWLVKQLQYAGYKPAVVSRGYGALDDKQSRLSWPREVNLKQDIALFGDEPYLIHQATGCPVVIDPNRARATQMIALDYDCDVIISDDGLQHYAMSRFIEINITDAKRLYGNGLCLPAGPLRESVYRLRSVDYIIYNVSRTAGNKNIKFSDDKSFSMDYQLMPLKAVSEQPKQSMKLADFKDKIVHAVAAIGDPLQFFRLLEDHGLVIIKHAFSDHYHFSQQDLLFEQDYPIIMTEKDALKCRTLALKNTWYLPIEAKLDATLLTKIIRQLNTY